MILNVHLGPALVPLGKGGVYQSPLPYAVMLAGLVAIAGGVLAIWRWRRSWLRLSVVSALCGVLALLLAVSFAFMPLLPASGSYLGVWLGGLLSLVAIGAALGAFSRPTRDSSFNVQHAALGLLTGLFGVLFAGWLLLVTVGGGLGG